MSVHDQDKGCSIAIVSRNRQWRQLLVEILGSYDMRDADFSPHLFTCTQFFFEIKMVWCKLDATFVTRVF